MKQYTWAMVNSLRNWNLSQEKLLKLQTKRLHSLLCSAYDNTEYYRKSMESVGFNPHSDFKSLEDLSKIPTTNKTVIKKTGVDSFLNQKLDPEKCFREKTTGSTGVPLTIYRSETERSIQVAKWMRTLMVNGYKPWDRVMAIVPGNRKAQGKTILQKLNLFRRHVVDFLCTKEEMAMEFLTHKPHVLYGNVASIIPMAEYLEELQKENKSLKFVVTTGEMLPDATKEKLSKIFKVPIVNSYGSTEMGVMAFETPHHEGMFLSSDFTYFEFLDDNNNPVQPGEEGRVVVTDLFNHTMPFIRYNHNDLAVHEIVKSGKYKNMKIVKKILGRYNDVIKFRNGHQYTENFISEVLVGFQNISKYRIVQNNYEQLDIILEGEKAYIEQIENDVKKTFYDKIPEQIDLNIIQKNYIEPENNSKFRTIISNLV
ncbi:MAG: AMP-binding protein [Bacteroidales bacterium]|nr:AMP-binding protein [Bacteroidales bacterium]